MLGEVSPEKVTRRHLASGKKRSRLSASACLGLAAQVQAVDLGLKPALLYDTNCASPDQVRRYLCDLQEAEFVGRELHLLVIDDSVLIVNQKLSIMRLEELLLNRTSVTVVDVGQHQVRPTVVDLDSTGMDKVVQSILGNFRALAQSSQFDAPLVRTLDVQLFDGWNLCSLFGLLLGYPVTYWFDPRRDSTNCLGMVPLQVMRASALCAAVSGSDKCCLYSFSVPEGLVSETQTARDLWAKRLRNEFQRQSAFAGLSVSTETVCLPSVVL
uniref:Zgc:112163 n=1 Tax=Scleropages formosus TaxID=113540 RepID=A0A8C9VFQ5_SCLFO